MSKRRPPTAGTFARLAAASAVACAVLPEIVDLTAPYWWVETAVRAPTRVATEPAPIAGPRVMGAYQTADDDEAGVDRFGFAAGSPFDDARAAPGNRDQANAPGGVIQARVKPAPHVVEPDADALQRAGAVAGQDAPMSPVDQPAAVADPVGTAHMPTAPPPVAADAPPAPPALIASPPAAAAVAPPAPAPAPAAMAKPAREAEAAPAAPKAAASKGALPEKRPAAEPPQAVKRPPGHGGKPSRPRPQSASADGDAVVAKPVWRPENLGNWPD